MSTRHYTAWLVNDTSCLDQACMDLTVLEDELIGGDPEKRGDWSTDASKDRAFYGVTAVDAEEGDIQKATEEAEDMLREAGWRMTDKWEAVTNAYIVTVERES
jgi:hypothetical protein